MQPAVKKIYKRKPKVVKDESIPMEIDNSKNTNIQYIIEEYNTPIDESIVIDESNDETKEEIKIADTTNKKRGRKPKGGKLIMKHPESVSKNAQIANVILHLKCSMNDLNNYNVHMNQQMTDPLAYNPSVPPDIMMYNDQNPIYSVYDKEPINPNQISSSTLDYAYPDFKKTANNTIGKNICELCIDKIHKNNENDDTNIDIKDINQKLKKLKVSLYKNAMSDKKSACFWCTYEYDNPACYIPKYEMDGTIFGYGSFCRPECAVAFLMKETLDDSTKFERYHLLNQIYSKVYDYKKNIKPAPNPYFLLEKYYGNLSIQEYRRLLKSEHMLLVIDKPMTRILPELHEDTEDFILNIYGNHKNTAANTSGSGIYKVKKQSEKMQGPTKTSIIRDKFGLAQ